MHHLRVEWFKRIFLILEQWEMMSAAMSLLYFFLIRIHLFYSFTCIVYLRHRRHEHGLIKKIDIYRTMWSAYWIELLRFCWFFQRSLVWIAWVYFFSLVHQFCSLLIIVLIRFIGVIYCNCLVLFCIERHERIMTFLRVYAWQKKRIWNVCMTIWRCRNWMMDFFSIFYGFERLVYYKN